MSIWIIFHDEWPDSHESVREVYASEELAKANLTTRTPSGRRSTALDAHSERCCRIEEWTVVEA